MKVLNLTRAAFWTLVFCVSPVMMLAQVSDPDPKEEQSPKKEIVVGNDNFTFEKKVKPTYIEKKYGKRYTTFLFTYQLNKEVSECELKEFTVTVIANYGTTYEKVCQYEITPYKCEPDGYNNQNPVIWCKKYKLIDGEDVLKKYNGTYTKKSRKRKSNIILITEDSFSNSIIVKTNKGVNALPFRQ